MMDVQEMILTKFLIGNSKKEEIEEVALKKKYFHILNSYLVFMIPQCSRTIWKIESITVNSWKTMVKSTRSETQCSLYFVNKITFISAQDWYAFKHRYMLGERNIVF